MRCRGGKCMTQFVAIVRTADEMMRLARRLSPAGGEGPGPPSAGTPPVMATDGASSLDRRNSTPTTPVPAFLQRLIAEISISFKHTSEVGEISNGGEGQ